MTACEMCRLVLRQEGEVRCSMLLPESASIVIGRNAECDLVVADRRVSSHHARVQRHNNRYLIEDLGSKNGTFVNGKPLVEPVTLSHGDEIQIAFCIKIAFQLEETPATLS